MKHLQVVAAIIMNNAKILCVQRNISNYEYISKKYEFPGGKIELGETKEAALIREIQEELQLKISIDREFLTVHHDYPDFKITMYSFVCQCAETKLTLLEHIDYQWLSKTQLDGLDWAAADIPIVNMLKHS